MALFGKDPEPQRPPVRSEPTGPTGGSVIGKKLLIDGKITGTEPLAVEGQVKGEIDLESDLKIGAGARIEAKVHARNVTVEGSLVGDVSADARVELTPSANVDGNITAPKIVVSEGAIFKGAVNMGVSQKMKVSSSDSKEKN